VLPVSLGDAVELAAIAILAVLLFLVLFEPPVAYRVRTPTAGVESREFVNYLSAIVNARVFAPGEVLVLNGGERAFAAIAESLDPADHAKAIRGLILRYGTPAERLGRGPSFRLRPIEGGEA